MNDAELDELKDRAAIMANYARAISAHCVFRLAGYCRGDCRGRDICKTEGLKVIHTPGLDLDIQRASMGALVMERELYT